MEEKMDKKNSNLNKKTTAKSASEKKADVKMPEEKVSAEENKTVPTKGLSTDVKDGEKLMNRRLSLKGRFKGKGLLIAAYAYVFLPAILFVTFWLRWYIGIPFATLIICCCYDLIESDDPIWRPKSKGSALRDNRIKIIVALAIIMMWVLSSGIGGSVTAHGDQWYKNRMFMMLINNPWPMRMNAGNGTTALMTYYIGYWLPVAFISKLTSLSNALLFLQIWSIFGIYLIWRFVCEKYKTYKLWFLAVFIFFGGLDALGKWLTGNIYADVGNNYEWWAMFYTIPGFTTQLFWAYNHIIPGILIFCLIDRQKTNKGILLIWANALLSCTFPAVGLIPFAAYRAIANAKGNNIIHRFADAVKKCVTLPNVAGFLLALLFTLYLFPNVTLGRDLNGDYTKYDLPQTGVQQELTENKAGEEVQEEKGFSLIPEDRGPLMAHPWTTRLWIFSWFFLLEAGLFFFFTYDYAKKKPIYWVCLGALLVLPWIHVGDHNDFCMRATIPAMFVLYEIVVGAMGEYKAQKKTVLVLLLSALIVGSSITAFNTIQTQMSKTALQIEWIVGNGGAVYADVVSYDGIATVPHFSASEDSFFGRYLLAK